MAIIPDLAGHISKLEMMYDILVEDINAIVQPTVFFTHINELKILDIANNETNPNEKYQDNGTTPLLSTQPPLPHSPLIDTSIAPADSLPHPRVEAGDATVIARVGDLLNVCLLGADDMLFRVYQDWVHKNPGNYLDGGITENGKWQAR